MGTGIEEAIAAVDVEDALRKALKKNERIVITTKSNNVVIFLPDKAKVNYQKENFEVIHRELGLYVYIQYEDVLKIETGIAPAIEAVLRVGDWK